MSDYEVRPATWRDAKAVAEVHVASWRAAYKGILPDDDLAALSVTKREGMWKEAIQYAEPQLLVATNGSEIAGFAGFDRSRDKGTPATMGEIWALYALPQYWSKGVGLALWDALLPACVDEGFTSLSLWVMLRNERALRFYEQAGFKRDMASLKTAIVGSVKVEEIRLRRAIG